jgi:hypothetical protein
MTYDPETAGPSGPNWGLLLLLALSALMFGLAVFGAFTLAKLIL